MPDPTPVDLRADGILWYINRTCFHPRGFSLGFNGTDYVMYGTGGEPWQYDRTLAEADLLTSLDAMLARVRREQSGQAGIVTHPTPPPIVEAEQDPDVPIPFPPNADLGPRGGTVYLPWIEDSGEPGRT